MYKIIRIMTSKLTLSVDGDVIIAAKKYAKERGKSLSDLVENYLLSLSDKSLLDSQIDPKILNLMGSLDLPKDFDYKKDLSNSLSKKFKQ